MRLNFSRNNVLRAVDRKQEIKLIRLTDIINEMLVDAGREPMEELSREMRLRQDLGFDSLELAVLTVKIEAEFGVDVFADGLVRTVGQILDKLGA